MKIPSADIERVDFYREVIRACFVTVVKRKQQYELMKHYFLNGCAPEDGTTPYNKIYPTIDTLTAFIFSADSTRFSCHLSPDAVEADWEKVPAASKAVNSEWINSNGDMIFGQALMWALCYNSTFVKSVVRDGHMTPFMIEPICIGVYREDLNYINRQEAIAHRYTITRSQLERDLKDHPQRAAIMAQIVERPERNNDEMPDGLRRIIVSNQTQNGIAPISPGNTIRGNGAYVLDGKIDYYPTLGVDTVDMVELWLWDDDLNDYRTVTMADEAVVIFDRQNIFLPTTKDTVGEHPFTHVCPNPMAGYFWGISEVGRLVGLQQFRNERIQQIRDLLAKQVDPPTTLYGMFGAIDELDFALNKAGGLLSSSDPMAKVERYKPEVPHDVWNDVMMIDEMFAEASALQNLLMGKGETGVRSGRQTSELARLGSSRIKKRALIVEDSLDALATKYYKVMRRYDDAKYMTTPTKEGEKPVAFVLAQMTSDVVVRVDAHSNSPLFVEDHKAEAGGMLEAHVIDRNSYLELTNPPMKEVLQRNLKKIEAKEAAAAKQKAEFELQMHQKPGAKPQ